MNSKIKGILGVVLGFFALFSVPIFNMLRIRLGATVTLSLSFLCALAAIVLGLQARKNNERVVGLVATTLGIIGVLVIGSAILSLII